MGIADPADFCMCRGSSLSLWTEVSGSPASQQHQAPLWVSPAWVWSFSPQLSSQICHSDQSHLAFVERRWETRCPPLAAVCQHGQWPVPAGEEQSVHQSPRVCECVADLSPRFLSAIPLPAAAPLAPSPQHGCLLSLSFPFMPQRRFLSAPNPSVSHSPYPSSLTAFGVLSTLFIKMLSYNGFLFIVPLPF